jgi:hypothetical protein
MRERVSPEDPRRSCTWSAASSTGSRTSCDRRSVMHRPWALGLAAAVLAACAGGATAQSAPRLGQVGWLAGCWERSTGPRIVEEQWMRPRAGLMLGASRTVHGDSLVDFEQVRLLERDGHLIYAAEPAGQPPAGRRLARGPHRGHPRRPDARKGFPLPQGGLSLVGPGLHFLLRRKRGATGAPPGRPPSPLRGAVLVWRGPEPRRR